MKLYTVPTPIFLLIFDLPICSGQYLEQFEGDLNGNLIGR